MPRIKRITGGAACGVLSWCLVCLAVLWSNPAFVDTALGWLAVAMIMAVGGAFLTLLPVSGKRLFRVWACLVAPAVLALAILLASRVPRLAIRDGATSQPTPILVLGLDGASWSVLAPLVKAGETPNLARLIRDGAAGTLTSIEPMMSPRLWASIDTGLSAERHGVLSFFSTQADLRATRCWEWLAAQGRSVGLMEWYLTWPPPETTAWTVPGLFAPDEQTRPSQLRFLKTLARLSRPGNARPSARQLADIGLAAVASGMRLSTGLQCGWLLLQRLKGMSGDERYVEEHLCWSRIKGDVFSRLVVRSRPDWAALFLNETDVFAHRYWALQVAGNAGRMSEAIRDAYRAADHALGVALEAYGERRPIVVLVSDHGFRANSEAGVKGKVIDSQLAELLGLDEKRFQWTHVEPDVFLRARAETEPATMAQAAAKMRSIQVRGGPFLDVAELEDGSVRFRVTAGLDFDLRTPVQFDGRSFPAGLIVDDGRSTGVHDLAGVVVLAGPGVRSGAALEGASVLDIAPTLFALSDEPVPEGLDGRVLQAALDPEWLARHPIRKQPALPPRVASKSPAVADHQIEEELRSLGYAQ